MLDYFVNLGNNKKLAKSIIFYFDVFNHWPLIYTNLWTKSLILYLEKSIFAFN